MTMNRRQFTQSTAAIAASSALPLAHAADEVKIGYVSPQTGPLAPFGEADRWVIDQMKTVFKDGISSGGKMHAVQISLKDSQSNPNRAGEVANDLILKDKVTLMLTAGTPETANPVCDACELNGVPCISSVVPWQPWFFGRKGDPAKGFEWTYNFFFSGAGVNAAMIPAELRVPTNRTIGVLWANDDDGNARGDKELASRSRWRHGFHAARPGPLPKRHAGFQRADRRLQEGQHRDRHRRRDPARREDVSPKRASRASPKVTLGKALVFPARGAGTWQRLTTEVVEPVAPLFAGATDRLCACAIRSGRRYAQARQVAEGC
jgi:branched-chain amino acid transport system substrate-binding protein